MPRYESAALREERAQLHQGLKAIYDTAKSENRDITAEETQEAERIEKRFSDASKELRHLELVEGYSPEQRKQPGTEVEQNAGAETRGDPEAEREYRDALVRYLTTGDGSEIRAAHSTQIGANGGFNVPESWASGIRDVLVDAGAIRGIADVQETATGNIINFPVLGTPGSADLRTEGDASAESEDQIDTVPIGARDISTLVKASREYLRDGTNVDAWIQRRIGQRLAVKEGSLYAVGTGPANNQPQGIMGVAPTGKTAASTTAVAYGDMVDLMFSVSAPYRGAPNAAWLVGDTTAAALMKLEDTEGHLIWIVNTQVGQPDTFLGKRIFTDPNIPTIASGHKSVAFGDWGEYLIRVAGGVEIQVLQELFAVNGMVGFLAHEYVDANLLNRNAIKTLEHA